MPTESEIPILKNQLAIAAGIWKEIEPSPHPADRWLGNYFHRYRRKMGSRDRRFFSEIIYGLFRNKMFLKAWSAHLEIPEDPFALVVLSALLEELIDPDTFRDTVRALWRWDWSAKLLPRFEDFKQGALPEIADLSSEEILGLRYSFPMWLVERWTAAYGEEKTKALFEIFHERPPLVVRTNPLKTTREELMARLKRGGFPVSVSPISSMGLVFKERAAVFNLEEFTEGLFEVQDAGSQRVCEAVGARPGDAVWDVCAGSGGKSLSLAAMMQNKGRIVATDIRKHKLDDLKKRASRAGVYNIFPADLDRMDEMKLAKKGFDKILVDAPCSGTGTLKRNPDAKWKLSPEEFGKYQEDQLKIIKNSLRYLKKGGRLYYVTCSIEEVENEGVMDRLMKEEAGLVPVVDIEFGEASGPWRRLWPAHENDGFFLGVVEKI